MECEVGTLIRPERRQEYENTVVLWGARAHSIIVGWDAFRMCLGQKPQTFTPAGVMAWLALLYPAALQADGKEGGDGE